MTPPQQFFDFVVGGSSQPERAREALKTANFYGNDAIWVLLPENGESPPTFEKILAYRVKPGTITIVAWRIDGPAPYTDERRGDAPSGYGEIGFQASGVNFSGPGCWEVTYQLNGGNDLKFVLKAR